MVLITDARGALEYVNPRFSAVTGYTLGEVRGQASANPQVRADAERDVPAGYWETITAGGEWRGAL